MITHLLLDVLKPRTPNLLDFANAIAERNPGCRVRVRVDEVDDKTESTVVDIQGHNISYENVADAIAELGGSVHSIDEVEVGGAT